MFSHSTTVPAPSLLMPTSVCEASISAGRLAVNVQVTPPSVEWAIARSVTLFEKALPTTMVRVPV